MNDYVIGEVDRLTRTTEAERQSLVNWFSNQGEQTRLEAFKLQGDLVRQSWNEKAKEYKTEFFYSKFIDAVNKMQWTETAQRQKQALTVEEAKKITEIRISRIKAKRKKKSSPLRDLIRIRFYEEIKHLKQAGLSWREISEYIALHHKKRFSHGWLQQCFEKLTKEKEECHGNEI
jgi:hypothetical protein